MKLCNSTLGSVAVGVRKPSYDRSRVTPGIVHLGLGAFHRAHQAVFTESVLESGDLRWGIVGAGLVSGSAKQALAPQDGLFTLVESSARHTQARIIGAVLEVLDGSRDFVALFHHLCAPTTCVVSMTVTEKGYHLDPATKLLQLSAADVQHDLQATDARQRTILGLIVRALQARRAAGVAPFTVLSCDNLPANGTLARAAVIAFAEQIDAELARWIAAEVAFPNSVVDRITPATTDADRAAAQQMTGLEDAWPIMTEAFTQWVIEDHFTMARPDWTVGGAVFSNDVERWEELKLRCLNGAHSTLAYLGQLAGREMVSEAISDEAIARIVEGVWQEQATLLKPPCGVQVSQYQADLKQRFLNPAVKHRTAQIAMDGSQKLPQRLIAPLRERMEQGLASPAIAMALAAWMHYIGHIARSGQLLSDPLAPQLLQLAEAGGDARTQVSAFLSLESIFGHDLAASDALRNEVTDAYTRLAADTHFSRAAGSGAAATPR